jgi:hypothetical protein
MIEQIFLLTDTLLLPDLAQTLLHANPALKVVHIETLDQLNIHCQSTGDLQTTRLLSFGSEIIVPATVLNKLHNGAYNFHPGPPTLPGRFPSCFCIYQGDTHFGSTLHEMTEKVDCGPINAVDWFDVSKTINRLQLDTLSFKSLFGLFCKYAPHLGNIKHPLARSFEVWTGKAKTQRDFDDLCHLPSDVTKEEFDLRYRSVGEGPNHALSTEIFGQSFRLDNGRTADDIAIAGKKIKHTDASQL